jgi:excisionase family DNA binding protein
MKNRWLSVYDISSYVGVRRETIYRWIEKKSFPAHRVGRLWKFKKEEVDGWIVSESARGGMAKSGKEARRKSPDHTVRVKKIEILGIAEKHGAKNVRIFGSLAREEAAIGSDVDFLVEMGEGRTLLDLVALSQDLEDLLGCRVHVISEGGVSPHLKQRIYEEAVPL